MEYFEISCMKQSFMAINFHGVITLVLKSVLGFGVFQVSSFHITDAQHIELNKYTNRFEAGARRTPTALWISAVWITGRISLLFLILISKWHQFSHVSKLGSKL